MQPDVKKNKSYFSELGFKKTIDQLIKQIAELYVKDDIPWVVGYSGGKDSSACLQLMWQTLEYLKQNNKTLKPLYVITTDTLVENPIVSGWVKSSLHLLKTKAAEKGLPIYPNLLTPNIKETFWVNLIGKGYPAPRPKFRWCTERMKIRPSDRFLRKIAAESGEAIIVIGSRKAESPNRSISINKFEKETVRDNFTPHVNLSNVFTYLPIKNWSNDDVWLYILQEECPWGIKNKDLLSMYKGATDGGECPLVIDTSTPSCGDSRFGCWVCTLVQKDKSMSAMVQNDDEKSWMEPLLQLRNELDQHDHDKRDFRRLSGNVQLFVKDDERSVPGPYTKKNRELWLTLLLKAQSVIRKNPKLPSDLKSIELISQEELDEIRRIWFYEKLEIEDTVPKICKQEVKGQYHFEALEDSHVFDYDILKILKETCTNDDLSFELARGLLEIERKYYKSNRRSGLFDAFENVFKKSFYKDKSDALDHAREKKKINEQILNQQLSLTGTK
jgi:DNA sulfur modification protein DndC